MAEMHTYSYDGPVEKYGKVIDQRWKGETTAPTSMRARSNLAWRYKQENRWAAHVPIALPGKLIQID